MGLVSHTRGLQTRISVVPSANRHKANFSPERQFTYYRSRSGRLIKKRRNRESSISREKFRFLQHIFPCPQEKWENETHHKSETPQQVSSEDSFQNGHIVKGLKSSEARRLGHIFRSERCLSARANFLETQEVPSVLCKQKMLPVQSVMLRTNLCPEGIHQVGSRSSSTFTTAKCQTSIVSRRLVSFESSQKVSSSRSREMPKSVDFTRLYCQQRKVLLDPDSNNNIHRGLVQSRAGKSVSNSRESRETDISSQSNANQAKCNCQRIFTSFGTDSILSGTNSKCTPLHEANTTSSSKFLETKLFGFDTGDSSYKTSKITSHMVVRYSKHYQGQIITASTDKGNHNDRCFENRVWRLPGQSVLSGELVSCSKETTYKYPGVGSSFLTLKHFQADLKGQNVLIRSDSTTVVQYLNKQGGTRSPQMCYRTWDLWNWAIENEICIKAAHILGVKNKIADHLSRNKVLPTEWTLNRSIVLRLFHLWGHPMIDLFASAENRQAPIFCSWSPHPQALALDALTISWDNMFAYAYPPLCLVPKVLQHMRLHQCQIILIAPQWPRRHWYTELLQLLVDIPRKLPVQANLLHQPKSKVNHPNPEVFNLTAWLLSTEASRRRAFLNKLDNCLLPLGERVHRKTTPASSRSSVAGVVQGKLIPILPL